MGSFLETYNADFCSSEGHNFISFFITDTCLPSLNKGVTLPYLRRYLTLPKALPVSLTTDTATFSVINGA